MDVKLVMAKGPTQGHVIQLQEPSTVVGRQRECGVRIPSADVSRRHCMLTYEDGVLYVEDLGSTNGTFINGKRIKGKQAIDPDDLLAVGPATFAVKYDAPHQAGDADVIPLVDGEDTGETALHHKTTKIDLAAKTSAPMSVDEVEVVEDSEEVLDLATLNMDEEPLNLPSDGDFRDLLSGLDGK